MRPAELRDLPNEALHDHILEARRELFGLRMQHATGELENSGRLTNAKRELARSLTIASQRGINTPTTTTEQING